MDMRITKTLRKTIEVIIEYFMLKKNHECKPEFFAELTSKLIQFLECRLGYDNNELEKYAEEYAAKLLVLHMKKMLD